MYYVHAEVTPKLKPDTVKMRIDKIYNIIILLRIDKIYKFIIINSTILQYYVIL